MIILRKLITSLFLLIISMGLHGCSTGSKAEKTWKPESEGILSASVSNTGRYVLFGTDSGKANLWKLGKKKSLLHSWQHSNDDASGITAVDLSENDKYAITVDASSLAWWRVKDGKILGFWKIAGIKSVAISKNGQNAIIGFRNYAHYLSLKKSKVLTKFEHPDIVKTVAISDDGRYAMTGSDNAEVRLWSLKKGKLLSTWKYKTKLNSVVFSPNGKYAMTSAVSGQTRIWRTKDGKLLHKLPPKRVTIAAAAFNSTGKKLVTGGVYRRIDLWDVKSAKNISTWFPKKSSNFRPSSANILDISFAAKDEKIISVTSNGVVQRWKGS